MKFTSYLHRNSHNLEHKLKHVLTCSFECGGMLAATCRAQSGMSAAAIAHLLAGIVREDLLDTNAHGLTYTQSHITMLPAPPNSSVQDYASDSFQMEMAKSRS